MVVRRRDAWRHVTAGDENVLDLMLSGTRKGTDNRAR